MEKDTRDVEFSAFVDGSSRRLLHAAFVLTGDRDRSEDLLQSALVAAYQRWGSIRSDDPFSYVRRSLVNAETSFWRRRRHERNYLSRAREPDAAPDVAENHALRDELQRLLRTLTPRERAVVLLRHVEDLSEAQTAAELGIAVGTVKSTSARALTKLRSTATLLPDDSTDSDQKATR